MNVLLIGCLTALSIFLIIYHHAGYPLLLHFLGSRLGSNEDPETDDDLFRQSSLPSITIVVPAYNEEQFIADKIRNLSILDYPQDRFQVIIASDGSTDATYQVALQTLNEPECKHCSIKVIEFA